MYSYVRLSWRAHPYVADWLMDRRIPLGQNSFFSRTIHIWKSLRAEFVIFWLLKNEKGIKYAKNHHRG